MNLDILGNTWNILWTTQTAALEHVIQLFPFFLFLIITALFPSQ